MLNNHSKLHMWQDRPAQDKPCSRHWDQSWALWSCWPAPWGLLEFCFTSQEHGDLGRGSQEPENRHESNTWASGMKSPWGVLRWGIYETLIDGRSHRNEHWPRLDLRRNITGMWCRDFRATWLREDCCLVTQSCSTFWWLHGLTHQAPLPMGFHRQEYWNALPFPPPQDLPNPGIKPTSPVSPILACRFFTTQPPGSPLHKDTS